MKANPAKSYFRRWGLLILLFIVAILVAFLSLTRWRDKGEKADETLAELKEAQSGIREKYQAQVSAIQERKKELKDIKKIPDEKRRLKKLAAFARKQKVKGAP